MVCCCKVVGLHAIVEGPAVEQGYQTTGNHAPSTDQVSAPDVPSSTSSDVPQRSPSTAGSAILPSGATPTLQAASPTRRLAAMLDTVLSLDQVFSTDLEETDAKPAARALVC
jgi:hypothetical protein